MVVGLAGKSCSGKNRVAALLEQKGFQTLDLDLTVRDIQDGMIPELADKFGSRILDGVGGLNRKALGSIVFADPAKLKTLEDMIYPALHRFLEDFLKQRESSAPLVLNAAALQKGDFLRYCDRVLWVQAPFLIRLLRARKRDARPVVHLLRRFAAQRELKSQYFFSRVDTSIIRNGSSPRALGRKVEDWIRDLPLEN